MKNLAGEQATDELHGRCRFSAQFVAEENLEGKDILDVGCGFGWFEISALDRGAKSVHGVEPAEGDLETARGGMQREGVRFDTGTATSLPYDDATFDTVVAWEVLEHVPKNEELRLLTEAHRVLREGGKLYLSTPHAALRSMVLDPAWWFLGHRHYAMNALLRLAKEAGFNVETSVVRGGWREILMMLDLYVAKWLFRRRPFWHRYMCRQVDREFAGAGGFYYCFLKLMK